MDIDYSDILLILGSFEGTPNLLELSDNRKHVFLPPSDNYRWLSTQKKSELKAPYVSVGFPRRPYDPLGWTFGSSPEDDCDYQLANDSRATGISHQYFRIDVDPKTKRPRLKCLSRQNPVIVHEGSRVLDLGPGDSIIIHQGMRIQVGTITFSAWEPARTPAEARSYKRKATDFIEEMLYSIPIPIPNKTVDPGETAAIRVGESRNVYIERETVARGTRGSILKVQDTSSMKYFAAKEPYYRRNDDADHAIDRREQLKIEHDILVSLDHPNIVQALDFAESHTRMHPPWMIMPFIPDTLSTVNLSTDEVPNILLQISRALEYLHARNVAHRDLKPNNILIMRHKSGLTVKLADVGEAHNRAVDQKNMDTFTGTSYFVAPEVLDKKRAYTKAVDNWSFGIIILQLLLPDWSPQDKLTWNSAFAPTKEDHKLWIDQQLRPAVELVKSDSAKKKYLILLNGTLQEAPQLRWTAVRTREWLESDVAR